MTWSSGDVARFKEKGNEFATAVVGANTIGMANVIDPNNPKDALRLHLIGQPLSTDPSHNPGWLKEGGVVSKIIPIPIFNDAIEFFRTRLYAPIFIGLRRLAFKFKA